MPSIYAGRFVRIDGLDQWIAARGERTSNPGLFIIGGPGVALSRMSPLFAEWEHNFTVIHWDQPGAGATVARDASHGGRPLSVARLARDAEAAIEAARDTFGAERIAVLGYSAGSVIGLHLARQRPDLICAYIGVSQFVNWRRQDALSYEMVLQRARIRGDQSAIADLERIGPPPYADASIDAVKSRYANAMSPAEQNEFASLDANIASSWRNPPPDAPYLAPGLPPQDPRALAMAAYANLRPELMAFEALSLGATFGVAMFFFQGAQDAYAVSSEVEAYARAISAPSVRYAAIEDGGHNVLFLRRQIGIHLDEFVRPLFP